MIFECGHHGTRHPIFMQCQVSFMFRFHKYLIASLWRNKHGPTLVRPPVLARASTLAPHAVLTLRTTTTAKTGQHRRRRSRRRQRRRIRFKLVSQNCTVIYGHPLAYMPLLFLSFFQEPLAEIFSGKPARMSTALVALAGLSTGILSNTLKPLSNLDSVFVSLSQVNVTLPKYDYIAHRAF